MIFWNIIKIKIIKILVNFGKGMFFYFDKLG